VVGITPRLPGGPLAGHRAEAQTGARAFELAAATMTRRLSWVGDFIEGRPSTQLGSVEPSVQTRRAPHRPRLCPAGLRHQAIREALPAFDQQIKGSPMKDAVLTGVETRTSSPLRMPAARIFRV